MDTPLPPKIDDDDDIAMDHDDGSTSLGSKRSLSLSTDTLDSLGTTSDPGSIPSSSSGFGSGISLGIAASDRKRSRSSMSGSDIDSDSVRGDVDMDVTATGSLLTCICITPPSAPY